MYLLDTNVLSEMRRARGDAGVRQWVRQRHSHELFISVMTVYEIELGIRRLLRRDQPQALRLRQWLHNGVQAQFVGRILPLDAEVMVQAAELQVPDPKPDRDCFIAATALVKGLYVVTRNERDFMRLRVNVINPWHVS